jgi:hypothetical protein
MTFKKTNKNAQSSVEYLIIAGFVCFMIIGILSLALVYSGSIRDRIRINQITNSANKIISASESVFYAGSPSKSTTIVYFPENIKNSEILEDSLIFTIQTSSGISKISFSSKVPIQGSLNVSYGLNKIQILAQTNQVEISNIS